MYKKVEVIWPFFKNLVYKDRSTNIKTKFLPIVIAYLTQFRKTEFVMDEMTGRTLLNIFHAIFHCECEYLIIF